MRHREYNTRGNSRKLDPDKYLSKEEAAKLLNVAQKRARCAKEQKKIPIREYFIIHLGLATGLRVMEIANLKCGDLYLEGKCQIYVREGKFGKSRYVIFYKEFQKHCREYLMWKVKVGESVKAEEPLIVSSNSKGHMSRNGIQKVFKRCAARAGINSVYGIHSMRHTNAGLIIDAGGDINFVKNQFGHSDISTTQIYMHTFDRTIGRTMNKFSIC